MEGNGEGGRRYKEGEWEGRVRDGGGWKWVRRERESVGDGGAA